MILALLGPNGRPFVNTSDITLGAVLSCRTYRRRSCSGPNDFNPPVYFTKRTTVAGGIYYGTFFLTKNTLDPVS